jgi:hypothetical protein
MKIAPIRPLSVGKKGEKMRSVKDTMICWTPPDWPSEDKRYVRGEVGLYPWPDKTRQSDRYAMTGGATYSHIHQQRSFEKRKTETLIAAIHMIVRDGCDPQKVHQALLGLEEYLDACSDDMPGVAKLRRC